ncbi:7,8-didemethyl-8-hydroxy-5-deazariboflavin synthase subunit CofH [Halorussus pelagicus]|uniref:7,8-didemethyl-8-hydroxy-5-deazariboflavin synthase subunit CofH n=1 Tax=Halorussus pelagicus TaxID=2505977 RepID=UPI000FFBA7B2|nr:7,8-didemethyl-8-hydroxy-5-deazariboflavin synthase subunit CofH [Halorussus pelagicus]
MEDAARTNVPRGEFDFEYVPETDQSFENALAKASDGERLSVADGIELMTTGTDREGIHLDRKERVLETADRRRAEVVGEGVTFVANLNNNVTTACNTGCLFCNFKNTAQDFETDNETNHGGFTKTPEESRKIVESARETGIYEVTSVSGLHPGLALDDEHLELLEASDRGDLNYKSPSAYETDPGTYVAQMEAMNVGDVHLHSMTPEEAYHARRGTDWSYEEVYRRLKEAGLDSVPGTAAEILVDEVRGVICPGKIGSDEWVEAMEAAAKVGLDTTATIMYGHVENEAHRVMHLKRIRDLQDRTDNITEFVPLSFVHSNTPLAERGMVEAGATTHEDELMIAVSRLFLDNIENIQSSWVKYGDEQGLKMLSCGANDFMGTILSEEITKRAGGEFGEARSFAEYVEMITAIGRTPVERSTDYRQTRVIDPSDPPFGPELGPAADGSPLVPESERTAPAESVADD